MVRKVAIDTSVLINFALLDRLDLLAALPGVSMVVLPEVEAELARPELVARCREGFERRWLIRLTAAERAASGVGHLESVAALRARGLDLGESACLAIAAARGWLVACDERRLFLRVATEVLGPGRVVDTPMILLAAIRSGALDVAGADRAKDVLAMHRYRMSFGSFAGLLD